MKFYGQHILTSGQFDKEGLLSLFEEAHAMQKILEKGKKSSVLDGKVLATLFFEPSTRTRFSFESAMLRLGGSVISNADMMQTSSLTKMETLYDTGKVVSKMADVIVARHSTGGAVSEISRGSEVPVINAGDGAFEHPTQGLIDVYTIWKEKGRLADLTVGLVGDLKFGRVPHSQCKLLKHFKVKFLCVAPKGIELPEEMVLELKDSGCEVEFAENLEQAISEMDVIGMTRVQKERFSGESEYKKYAGSYVLDGEVLKKAKKDAVIIHPLPRVNEISVEVDSDPRAKYFGQVRNGVALRMALLKKVLVEE
ncbi:aspartate carbamoyltransferase [Candidatus Peregrinibacteria bacterium]|nr:aspartate carbamoyltransferase [Candidatus Peregrinibacteria bacterium]